MIITSVDLKTYDDTLLIATASFDGAGFTTKKPERAGLNTSWMDAIYIKVY